MQLIRRIENYMPVSDGLIGAGAGTVAGGLLSWLVSSLTKVNKPEFKELVARVANLEKDRITRDEFERDMSGLRELIREFRSEIRADMKEIKAKV